jgi:hypothetical protein
MRRVTILLVVALVAAGLGVAGPARAADEADCLTIAPPPDINSVEINGLTITVHPDQVGPDALAQVNYYIFYLVVGRTLCLEGGIVTGKLPCIEAKIAEIVGSLDPVNLNLRYVRQDPSTGDIVIDGNLLVADLTAC